MLSAQGREALKTCLSPDRLATYETAVDGGLDAALALYTWNQQASAAFFEVLNVVEIIVRNALHRELTTLLGQRWWEPSDDFDKRTARHIRTATQRVRDLRLDPDTVPPGKVVSHMTFGIWVALLDSGGKPPGGGARRDYEQWLWRPALHRAFPNRRWRRKQAFKPCQHLNLLRNRIAHHEPIFRGVRPSERKGAYIPLSRLLDDAFELVDAVDHDAAEWLRHCSGIRRVLLTRPPVS